MLVKHTTAIDALKFVSGVLPEVQAYWLAQAHAIVPGFTELMQYNRVMPFALPKYTRRVSGSAYGLRHLVAKLGDVTNVMQLKMLLESADSKDAQALELAWNNSITQTKGSL